MDTSVHSAIERIKLEEKDNEEKLKEKREFEGMVVTLNRAIRDTVAQTEKLSHELTELTKRVDIIRVELDIERIRHSALSAQVEATSKELDELRAESDRGVSSVWELRSSLCTAVQKASNEWDIQALLTKRVSAETSTKANKKQPADNYPYENKLKLTNEKLEKVIEERDYLLKEPENGEEFKR